MYGSINTLHRMNEKDDGRILRLIGKMNGLQGVEKMKGWSSQGSVVLLIRSAAMAVTRLILIHCSSPS